MNTDEYLVLGGGLSGLFAAWRMAEAGCRLTLVEARPRLGGRIFGAPALGAEQACRFDLGPAWYWPDFNPRLSALVDALGLVGFRQASAGAALFETPDGGVERIPVGALQHVESWRVSGGMTRLVDALSARLDGVNVLCSTRVMGVAADAHGVAVQLCAQTGTTTRRAARVVCAVPPRLLAPWLDGAPGLPPGVPAALRCVPTWMAGQAKFVAQYARPFWREAGLSGDAFSRRGPLGEIHDASDADGSTAALFGFVGVPAAQRAKLGRARLQAAALAQLTRLFGSAAGEPLACHLQDWADEPETATVDDQTALHAHPQRPELDWPAAWSSRVFLAGSEFADGATGYLEGALEAAEAAVTACLAQAQTSPH